MSVPAGPPPIPEPFGAAELFPCGWPQRLWFLWAAAILPAFAFVVGLSDLAGPQWRRPDAGVWLQLLLNRPGALAFAPLAAVAALTALAVFWRPGPWVAKPWVRTALLLGFVFELALRELSPGFHHRLRQVYDAVAPRLAARISTPGRAALAWLALRPAELLAAALLRLFAGRQISRRAASLYRR